MDWVPPPMREHTGEVQAALSARAARPGPGRRHPGDLHTHTNLTDGVATLEEMVTTARASRIRVLRGHRPRAEPVHAADDAGQDARAARPGAQARSAAGSDGEHPMSLLHGTELNIAADGTVDWPRGHPGRVRRLRRLGALAFRPAKGRDDQAVPPGLREPAGARHRAPDRPQDRQAPARRRGLAPSCSAPARPPAPRWRSTPARPARPAVGPHQGGHGTPA